MTEAKENDETATDAVGMLAISMALVVEALVEIENQVVALKVVVSDLAQILKDST